MTQFRCLKLDHGRFKDRTYDNNECRFENMEPRSELLISCKCGTTFNVAGSQLGKTPTCPKCQNICVTPLADSVIPDSESNEFTSSGLKSYEKNFKQKEARRIRRRARATTIDDGFPPKVSRKTPWPYVLYAGAAAQFIFPILCWIESSDHKHDAVLERLAVSVTWDAVTYALLLASIGFITKCVTDMRWMQAEKDAGREPLV